MPIGTERWKVNNRWFLPTHSTRTKLEKILPETVQNSFAMVFTPIVLLSSLALSACFPGKHTNNHSVEQLNYITQVSPTPRADYDPKYSGSDVDVSIFYEQISSDPYVGEILSIEVGFGQLCSPFEHGCVPGIRFTVMNQTSYSIWTNAHLPFKVRPIRTLEREVMEKRVLLEAAMSSQDDWIEILPKSKVTISFPIQTAFPRHSPRGQPAATCIERYLFAPDPEWRPFSVDLKSPMEFYVDVDLVGQSKITSAPLVVPLEEFLCPESDE